MDTKLIATGLCGVVIGLLFGSSDSYVPLVYGLCEYVGTVVTVRTLLSYAVSFVNIHKIESSFFTNYNLDALLDENITINYNMWYNRIVVKRNMSAKMSTSSECIELALRKIFNIGLGWDVFYHYNPLTIKFE